VTKDWSITRRGDEPRDFWSQSFCWGALPLENARKQVRVRFHNSGGRSYGRCEAHLVYRAQGQDATKVTFAWTDDRGPQRAAHTIAPGSAKSASWIVPTRRNVETRWVEMEAVGR
jgi:hypothetical protein